MKSTTISPPGRFGLQWQPLDHPLYPEIECWTADRTPEFSHADFCARSIVRTKSVGNWLGGSLLLRADTYDASAVATWFDALQAAVDAQSVVDADEKAAARVASEAHAATMRKLRHDCTGPRHAAAVRETIAEAEALYDQYGAAVRRVTPLLRLIGYVYLTVPELNQLRKLLIECRGYVDEMEEKALEIAAKDAGKQLEIELDDAFIERGIRFLTENDTDKRKLGNGVGWGGDTGPPGHWCYDLLKTDRERAIRIGRPLVGRHLAQLERLGVVPAARRKAA